MTSHRVSSANSAPLACEVFLVKIGYIWLMVLLPVAGLLPGVLSLVGGARPVWPGVVLALPLVALGYWAWRRGYRAVRLELRPDSLQLQPADPRQPAQAIPLARIANYLRPRETYYRVAELQLHGGDTLQFSQRLRRPPVGLLSLDDWLEQLAARLEQARPVAPAATTAEPVASGLLAERPRIFARTTLGKVLAGLAGVWLVLSGLARLGGAQVPGAVFLLPSLYLVYYYRARGELKTETHVFTGIEADRDNWRDND